jgi:hypothetical protein
MSGVSPVNYFLFTPMLPSATVGTLELRSLVEPIRRIVRGVRGHYLKAEARGGFLGKAVRGVAERLEWSEEAFLFTLRQAGYWCWCVGSIPLRLHTG